MLNFYEEYDRLRLRPNHEISQWYMFIEDAKKQVEFLCKNLKGNKILFLGDGDGISILLALKLCQEKNDTIKEIMVFDIDERELNLYEKIAKKFEVEKYVKFKTQHYNIVDKVPKEYENYFDFFYINPPYSYTTNPKGLGFMLWLDRCVEMTKTSTMGCIVYPFSHGEIADVKAVKQNLKNYLVSNHFNITSRPRLAHRYLDSECISRNMIVEKTSKSKSKYAGSKIPHQVVKALYHYCENPPHLIYDDGSEFGKRLEF